MQHRVNRRKNVKLSRYLLNVLFILENVTKRFFAYLFRRIFSESHQMANYLEHNARSRDAGQ